LPSRRVVGIQVLYLYKMPASCRVRGGSVDTMIRDATATADADADIIHDGDGAVAGLSCSLQQ